MKKMKSLKVKRIASLLMVMALLFSAAATATPDAGPDNSYIRITKQPVGGELMPGQTIRLEVEAEPYDLPVDEIEYAWYVDGGDTIIGTDSFLIVDCAGVYHAMVHAQGANGWTRSGRGFFFLAMTRK